MNNTPTNMSIFNRNRYTTFDNNRKYWLSEEINNGYYSKNDSNKIISVSNSSRNYYNKKLKKEYMRTMSNKDLFPTERYNKENQNTILDNKDNKYNNKIGVIKERKCILILKDGMKKVAKRLNSKEDKK